MGPLNILQKPQIRFKEGFKVAPWTLGQAERGEETRNKGQKRENVKGRKKECRQAKEGEKMKERSEAEDSMETLHTERLQRSLSRYESADLNHETRSHLLQVFLIRELVSLYLTVTTVSRLTSDSGTRGCGPRPL